MDNGPFETCKENFSMSVCKRSYRKIRTGLAFEQHRGTMGRKGEPNTEQSWVRENSRARGRILSFLHLGAKDPPVSTLPVAAQDSERRPQKSGVFFLVVADTICLLLMLNQLTVSQTHRWGSVLQVNQELSSELRFVSLGFPLRFPVPMFY